MGRFSGWTALVLFFLGFTTPGVSQTCEAPFHVGYRVVDLREGRKAALWYPAAQAGASAPYDRDGQLSGVFRRDGAPADCPPRPVVVFSHGLGGCGAQSLFLTEELARAGFIVIAPDHRDAFCSVDGDLTPRLEDPEDPQSLLNPESWTPQTRVDRRDDIRLAIDLVLDDERLGRYADPKRIAVAGHSLGGYAALGVAGGWEEWRDERVRAALLLSPYAMPFQAKGTLGQVRVPVMYQGAVFDFGITPFLEGENGAYLATNPPRYFVKLRGGTHFEWTNLLCAGDSTLEACLATSENARLINAYAVAFLQRHLGAGAGELLLDDGEGLRDYQRTVSLTSLSAASYDPTIGVAPESIVSAFGEGLADQAAAAEALPLPKQLAGLRLQILDAAGKRHESVLFYAGPNQTNFLAPAGLAEGLATVSAFRDGRLIAEGEVEVRATAPAVFSANATGRGPAAATFLRVAPDGGRRTGLTFDPETGEAVPLDVGAADGGELYLSLFGTGWRGGKDVSATVGGSTVAVTGPWPHGELEGLDQLNLGPLAAGLAGRGLVEIQLTLGPQTANATEVRFR